MASSRTGAHQTALPFSILLTCLVPRISAGTWIYPLPNTNPIFNRTDSLNATWATTFPEPYMVLWCQATGVAAFTAELNVSVPGAGSRVIDLSNYGNQTLGCHFDVAEAETGLPSLNSPNFHINDLESNPPTTWCLSDASTTTSSSATSSTSAGGAASTTPSAASATPTDSSSVKIPLAQAAVSSSPAPAPAQKTSASEGLSVGATVGITLGVVIIVITLLTTFWYIRRSHHTSDANQLEDLAAVKAAELESSRAVSEIEGAHMRYEKFGYPVGVGENPAAPAQELEGRPYWGRPF